MGANRRVGKRLLEARGAVEYLSLAVDTVYRMARRVAPPILSASPES